MSFSLLLLAVLVVCGGAALLLVVVLLSGSGGGGGAASGYAAPVATGRPLSAQTVAEISSLVAQDKKIHAIKVLREATGVGLKEAKDRVEGWSEAAELQRLSAAPSAPAANDERLRIEAAAIVAAAGWHSADAFLREQRGLTPEASRALLDSVS